MNNAIIEESELKLCVEMHFRGIGNHENFTVVQTYLAVIIPAKCLTFVQNYGTLRIAFQNIHIAVETKSVARNKCCMNHMLWAAAAMSRMIHTKMHFIRRLGQTIFEQSLLCDSNLHLDGGAGGL